MGRNILVINFLSLLLLLSLLVETSVASVGDNSIFFMNCRDECLRRNCTADGVEILEHAVDYYKQHILDKVFLWNCVDECQYHCMWKTVSAFVGRKWSVPQFYGKWPFIRMLGMQEPASVVFSLMNFAANLYLLRKLRTEVRPDSPCYWLWHVFFVTCLNGWIWSTVFHTRDFPLTELLDYASAYSIILSNLYCMSIRMIHDKSIILRGIVTTLFISFYLNYFSYLSVGRFSYSFNMKTNIVTGLLSGVGWIIWSFFICKKRPYSWKIVLFYILVGLSISLEVLDFSPIFWIFDAHSLFHLSSVPLNFLLYSFIRDDCKALRKEKQDHGNFQHKIEKEIMKK